MKKPVIAALCCLLALGIRPKCIQIRTIEMLAFMSDFS